jgi:F420-dependent oxidoreductase-like protein
MKLGYSAPAWGAGTPPDALDGVLEADRLGLDSVWTSETYGADAFTPLAWWGSRTTRVRLGTAIAQLSARPPTTTAMAALTLDHLSGGRLLLGVGASGPQVVEGWYGQPFARPLERTREYLDVVRQVVRRDEPVRLHGRHFTIPVDGGTGLGRALKSIVHPVRADLPVLLAAEGPKNIALAGEIADGWLPMWFSPKSDAWAREQLAAGFAAREPTLSLAAGFETIGPVYVRVDDDVEVAADALRPVIALYIGGMGARGANFHLDAFARLGWDAECENIQNLYLAGRKDDAIAAVPTALVEDVALVGPLAKIRDELAVWRSTTLTTMAVKCAPGVLAQLRDDFE